MIYIVLQTLHYVGLALLIGGPTFWFLVGRPALHAAETARSSHPPEHVDSRNVRQLTVRRIHFGIAIGLALFVVTSFGDIARIVWQISGGFDLNLFEQMLTSTQNGRVTLLQVAAAVGLALTAWRLPAFWLGPAVLGLSLGVTYAWTGHAASGGTPLLQPLDVLHVLAMGLWGGGLFYFALLPWRVLRPRSRTFLAEVTRRFSVLGILAVTALSLSGLYLSKERIHSFNALVGTPFGNAVLWKVGLLAVILLVAALNHFVFLPWVEAADRPWSAPQRRRFALTVYVEAVLVLAVLVATGALTTLTPPQRPAGLAAPIVEEGQVGPWSYDMLVEPGSEGSLQFVATLVDENGEPVTNASVRIGMDMLGHVMPTQTARLTEFEPGRYRSHIVPPMRGPYRAAVSVQAGGREDHFFLNIQVTSGVMDLIERDQEVRLSFERVVYSPAEWLFFLGYIALTVAGIILFRQNIRPPRSDLFMLSAVLSIAAGLWGIGTMVQVKAFPTTYIRNPVPVTAEVLDQGRHIFEQQCAVCHGPTGRGDGIAAPGLQPPPSDLTNWAMYRMHTEGDLYWFVSHGIAQTAMPRFQGVLTQEERWTVVRYIRELAREQRRGR